MWCSYEEVRTASWPFSCDLLPFFSLSLLQHSVASFVSALLFWELWSAAFFSFFFCCSVSIWCCCVAGFSYFSWPSLTRHLSFLFSSVFFFWITVAKEKTEKNTHKQTNKQKMRIMVLFFTLLTLHSLWYIEKKKRERECCFADYQKSFFFQTSTIGCVGRSDGTEHHRWKERSQRENTKNIKKRLDWNKGQRTSKSPKRSVQFHTQGRGAVWRNTCTNEQERTWKTRRLCARDTVRRQL